jgi:hypothetical protein
MLTISRPPVSTSTIWLQGDAGTMAARLVRDDYQADTLRGHLGRPVPPNRFAEAGGCTSLLECALA